jgi:serine/threonine protein kinase/Flp pilus assembly protein TadD
MNRSNAAYVPPDLELDGWLERFEAAAIRGGTPDPTDFLPDPSHPKYGPALRELLRLDLEFAWSRGDERHVEDYAARFPSLFKDPAALAEVAREEYRQRRAAGEDPDPAEYRRRLSVDLGVGGRPAAGPAWDGRGFPEPGQVVPPGNRILGELGRGAFGRVYLAEQADLAGRRVAVKISSRLVGEAQTLARLQHTHIVPIYAVHRVGEYQVLVMPFLGRTTLADVIAARRAGGLAPSTRRPTATVHLTGAEPAPEADRPGGPSATAAGPDGPPLTESRVIDIGIAIADALAHAHGRGILHRDVKPANILLSADGEPMLLDFNLAADDRSPAGTVGGTPRYMAPEQFEALAGPGTVTIDARADVYALGVVLYEALTGQCRFPDRSGTGLEMLSAMLADRRRPPEIHYPSPALAAVLRACLHPDPARRYSSAAALRDDLARHRDDRRLLVAREPFSLERARKWARRHPRLSSGSTVAAAAAVLLGLVAIAGYSAWRGNQELKAREARTAVARARDEVGPLVADSHGPTGQLREARRRALDALGPYDLPESTGWLGGANVRRLPPAAVDPLRADVAVLLAYAADATGYLAAREPDAPVRRALFDEALTLNERAGAAYPSVDPVDPFVRQRQWLLESAGRSDEARRVARELDHTASTPRLAEFFSALVDIRERRYQQAADSMDRLTDRGPPNWGVWSELGTARLRLGQYDRAADAFLVAGAIARDTPWPHFYRGVALLQAGRFESAIDSLDRFLARVDTEPDVWINRAIAHIHLKQWEAALRDLGQAEKHDGAPARLHALRELAWRQGGRAERAAAEHRLALAATPRGIDDWTVRGEARLAEDPEGAVADFDRALAEEPDYAPALRGKASALSERLNRPADAVSVLDRLLATDAATVGDRAGYAVLLARLGRAAEARTQARACLGAGTPAVALYQAASALAIAARTAADRQEVLTVLRRVLRADPAWARQMPGDPDLKTVRAEPALRALLDAAGVLSESDR